MEKTNDVNKEACSGHQWSYWHDNPTGCLEIHRKCNYCNKYQKRYVPDYKLIQIWQIFWDEEDKFFGDYA